MRVYECSDMGLGSLALGDYLLVLFGHVPFSRVDSAWDQRLSYLITNYTNDSKVFIFVLNLVRT